MRHGTPGRDSVLAAGHPLATGFPETDPAARAAAGLDARESRPAEPAPEAAPGPVPPLAWGSSFSPQTCANAVERVRDAIRAGDICEEPLAPEAADAVLLAGSLRLVAPVRAVGARACPGAARPAVRRLAEVRDVAAACGRSPADG
ncbi:hypothetical protein [Methylobacterium crusticola]|nr:hypothetical protein [Methylobacterium crusticola]